MVEEQPDDDTKTAGESIGLVLVKSAASIITALAALAAALIGLVNHTSIAGVNKKTVEIHALTNSNLNDVRTDLAVSQKKIEGLQALIASLIDEKSSIRAAEAARAAGATKK